MSFSLTDQQAGEQGTYVHAHITSVMPCRVQGSKGGIHNYVCLPIIIA